MPLKPGPLSEKIQLKLNLYLSVNHEREVNNQSFHFRRTTGQKPVSLEAVHPYGEMSPEPISSPRRLLGKLTYA